MLKNAQKVILLGIFFAYYLFFNELRINFVA